MLHTIRMSRRAVWCDVVNNDGEVVDDVSYDVGVVSCDVGHVVDDVSCDVGEVSCDGVDDDEAVVDVSCDEGVIPYDVVDDDEEGVVDTKVHVHLET